MQVQFLYTNQRQPRTSVGGATLERISRRQLLTTGGGAALFGAILGPGIAQAQADKPIASPWTLVYDIALDMPTGPPATGAFYGTGSIYRGGALSGGAPASGAVRLGTVRAWGWGWDASLPPGAGGAGGTVSLDVAGEGEIVIAGVLDNRVAIVGGTGAFRGANGQADSAMIGPAALRVWLDITTSRVGPN